MEGQANRRNWQRTRIMNLATWNVQGMRSKKTEIIREIRKLDIDITSLTETKKKGCGVEEIDEFILIHSGVPKEQRARRGVAILIKKKYKRSITHYDNINENIIKVHMNIMKRKLAIIAIYAPSEDEPAHIKNIFYNELQITVEKIGQNREIIIMGDCNARVGSKRNDKVIGQFGEDTINDNGTRLTDFCSQNELKITNGFFHHKNIHRYTWTQNTRQLRSIIDYIIIQQESSLRILDTRVYRGAECGSDHYLLKGKIYFKYKNHNEDSNGSEIKSEDELEEIGNTKFNLNSLTEESICYLYKRRLDEKLKESVQHTAEEQYQHIKKSILESALEALGKQEKQGKVSSEIWWNEGIEREIEEKKEAYHRWLNNKTTEDRERYKVKRNKIKRMVEKAKSETWDRKCAEIEQYTGGKKCSEVWKFINSVRKDKSQTPIQHITGKEWEEYYKSLLSESRPKMKGIEEQEPIQVEGENIEITQERVEKAIKNLKNRKSGGPGGIPAELIKNGSDKLKRMITTLFNKCLKDTITPREWKIGYLSSIYKKGDPRKPENYRGITVTPTFSRLYGKVLKDLIEEEYTDNEAEEQCGFRAGRSCNDNLFCLKQIIEKKTDRGRSIHLLFIDLSKAYDNVPVNELWKAMKETNINITLIKSIQELYKQTKIKIKLGEKTTKGFTPTKGLKQGCCLSPSLFKIYVEYALKLWKKKCKGMGVPINNGTVYTLQFADDQVLIAQEKEDLEYMTRKIREEYEKAGLYINIDKTKYLCIGENTSNIQLDNKNMVEGCDNYKYLGVRIEKTGRDEKEIRERITQGRRAVKRLNGIWWNKNLTKNRKMHIYNTIIKSLVLYGAETWRWTERDKSRLNALEMDVLRRSCGISRMDRVTNERVREIIDLKETMIEQVQRRQLIWYGHVRRMKEDRLPKQILEWIPPERRKPGRPRKSWEGNIKQALSERNLSEAQCQDRRFWRKSLESGQRRQTL